MSKQVEIGETFEFRGHTLLAVECDMMREGCLDCGVYDLLKPEDPICEDVEGVPPCYPRGRASGKDCIYQDITGL